LGILSVLYFPTIQVDNAVRAVVRFPPATGEGGRRENVQNSDFMKSVKSCAFIL